MKVTEQNSGVLCALGGGAALGLATQPVGWWWLAWIGLVPLWIWLGQEHPRPVPAFRLGFLLGMVYHATLLRWLLGMHPLDWMGIPFWPSLGIAVGLWLLVSATQAWIIGVWALALARCGLRGGLRVLYGAGVWLALHWLWGQGSTAFPWGDLAQTQVPDLWAVQVVRLGGSALLVGVLIGFNGLVAEAWLTRHRQYGAGAAALLLAVHGWGLWQSNQPLPQGPTYSLGVIQGNIPQNQKWSETGRVNIIETYRAGYRSLARTRPDLIILPETALPEVWPPGSYDTPALNVMVEQLREFNVPLLPGAFDRRGDQLANTLFALDGTGQVIGRYDKEHLVPLGEQIPLKEYIGWLIRKLSPLQRDLQPGDLEQVFATSLGPVGGGICFDSAFGEGFRVQTAKGARLLISITNDAWFGPAMAPEHHALEILRAVENERWLVRASNNGSSGIIDPRGRTVRLTGWNVYAEFVAPIAALDTRTLYVQWGDWVIPTTALLACLALVVGRMSARRWL